MCGTAVRLTISQVSVVSSRGKASERAGLKVLPLIVQTGRKPPPIAIVQVRSGFGEAFCAHAGQRSKPARHPCPVGHAARGDPELHQRADVGADAGGVPLAPVGAAAQLHRLAGEGREVDDDLGPLGRAEEDLAAPQRARHQAAVGADLDELGAV